MLGLTPEPVLWSTWQAVVRNHRNVRGLSFEYVGTHGSSVDRLAQRAKPPLSGGKMVAYPSSTGKKLSSPTPASLSEAKRLFATDTPSEEPSEQSLHSDKVAWRWARAEL